MENILDNEKRMKDLIGNLSEKTKTISNFSLGPVAARDLFDLYFAIDSYIKRNYLFILKGEHDSFNVRIDGNVYTLGRIFGPSIFIYMIKSNSTNNVVDINDVKENKIRGKENIAVNAMMKNIEEEIKLLLSMGVDSEEIKQSTTEMMLRIKYGK